MNIKKGQKVWINKDICGITETEIITVGRKYITVKLWKLKFDKDTFVEVGGYGLPAFLILDLEEYNRKCEIQKMKQKLYRYNWDKLDDDKLEKIYEIMKDIL